MKRAVTILGLALSTIALIWIGLQLDLARAWSSLGRAELDLVALAALVYSSLFILRGLRWSRLLVPLASVSVRTATEVFLVGFFVNNLLPARLGDVARGVVLSRSTTVPAVASLSSIVLERVLDGLTVVLFLTVALEAAPPSADWVRGFQVMMTAAFAGALALCVAVVVARTRTLAVAERILSFAPRLCRTTQDLLNRVADGFMSLSSGRRIAEVGVLSLAIWSIEVLVYLILSKAFGFSMNPFGLMLVMAILTLGLSAPSAPAFVGVFEGLIMSAIGLYGVSESEAFAFAVMLHAVHFLPGSVLGLWAATKNGIEWSAISSESGSAPSPKAGAPAR